MNRALLGAVKKGLAAKEAGLPESACPYHDKRKPSGKLSWSRAFQRAWFHGYTGRLTQLDLEALREDNLKKQKFTSNNLSR